MTLLAARLVSNLVYAFGGTVLFFVICNAAELYLRIDNNLGTYDISAAGNHRMLLPQPFKWYLEE